MKLTPAKIQFACRHLQSADPVMKIIIDAVGPYTLRFERDRFAMLVRSIVSQQISTTAARAIRRRLQELAGPDGFTSQNLSRFSMDELPPMCFRTMIWACGRQVAGQTDEGQFGNVARRTDREQEECCGVRLDSDDGRIVSDFCR